jgi:hypothetical protein
MPQSWLWKELQRRAFLNDNQRTQRIIDHESGTNHSVSSVIDKVHLMASRRPLCHRLAFASLASVSLAVGSSGYTICNLKSVICNLQSAKHTTHVLAQARHLGLAVAAEAHAREPPSGAALIAIHCSTRISYLTSVLAALSSG